MKKLLIGLCFLCASTPSMAAGANKMTMVTYFPVKYVAYSQVDVMKQMDVGLTSACQMNLGCSADEGFNTGKSLRVNNLLKIAGGKLELNDAPAIEGSTARIGSGNGVSDFDFETSLRVGNYKQGYTLQADNMYLSELNLFGYKFPKCEGETMSWQKLKLKNKEEVYLVCGEVEQIPFNGCQACSSYDENSTEYENCVLNNVSSCCKYADAIYTKRGQNAFELMKNTSCYTCEQQNGVDHITQSITQTTENLAYIGGLDLNLEKQYQYGKELGRSIDCLSRGYDDPDRGTWVQLDQCPSNDTCNGKAQCTQRCSLDNCRVFDVRSDGHMVAAWQCQLNLLNRLCRTTCNKRGW